jgi:hypothetical protein
VLSPPTATASDKEVKHTEIKISEGKRCESKSSGAGNFSGSKGHFDIETSASLALSTPVRLFCLPPGLGVSLLSSPSADEERPSEALQLEPSPQQKQRRKQSQFGGRVQVCF